MLIAALSYNKCEIKLEDAFYFVNAEGKATLPQLTIDTSITYKLLASILLLKCT